MKLLEFRLFSSLCFHLSRFFLFSLFLVGSLSSLRCLCTAWVLLRLESWVFFPNQKYFVRSSLLAVSLFTRGRFETAFGRNPVMFDACEGVLFLQEASFRGMVPPSHLFPRRRCVFWPFRSVHLVNCFRACLIELIASFAS